MLNAQPMQLTSDTRLLVLTGAGVSAESGIPTFRDANGLWENHPVEQVASPEGFADDPRLVWRFYSLRREAAARCAPNPAHRARVALEKALGDRFLLVTQNVDDLHRRAGNERLVEIHGNLFTSRCSVCRREPFRDERPHVLHDADELPTCDSCMSKGRESLLRPHIVWFGEMLDPSHMRRIERFVAGVVADRAPSVFLAVGTSGLVYPAAGLVRLAQAAGARTVLVNADPPANLEAFDDFHRGKAGEILPDLFELPS